MAQEYDKIINENLEKVILQLIRKITGLEPVFLFSFCHENNLSGKQWV
jgi:hypothetical protein